MTNEISCGIKNRPQLPEIESYFTALAVAGKSSCTIRNYRKDIEKMIEYFDINSMKDIQSLGIADYRKFIGDLKLAPSSVNAAIRNLGAGLNWLEENEFISGCKFRSIKFGKGKFVKQPKKIKDVLSDDESRKLILSGKNEQTKFMLALMLFVGLRNDEVRSIKMIDITNDEIVISGKGSKQRCIVMNSVLFRMYNEYLSVRNTDCEYLFYSNHSKSKMTSKAVLDRVKTAYSVAGLSGKKISPHRLRASAITNIIKETGLVSAMRVAGHSSVSVTMIYDGTSSEYLKDTLKNTTRTFGL